MVSIPRTRIVVGLTPAEADRLALELARMERALHEPGLAAFDVFDLDAAVEGRRKWLEAAVPAHEVEVGPFEIDVYPVTHEQWAQYMARTGARKPEQLSLAARQRFVTGISWREASLYAEHHGLALPTEAEWECAARQGRSFFTWGDHYFPQGEVAFRPPVDQPYAVGSRPETASARGVHDLLGYFGEYCADAFAPYPGADRAKWERLFPGWRGQRVVRGGYDVCQDATCVSRRGVHEDERCPHIEFRCVRRP